MKASRKGKAVYAEVGFWMEKNQSIHLTIKGMRGAHVAINQDPSRLNGHPTLYRRLAKLLADAKAAAPSN